MATGAQLVLSAMDPIPARGWEVTDTRMITLVSAPPLKVLILAAVSFRLSLPEHRVQGVRAWAEHGDQQEDPGVQRGQFTLILQRKRTQWLVHGEVSEGHRT